MREYSAKNDREPSEIRSDASENRKAIILAARKLLSEVNPDASLTEIAKIAGISRATLYRNFADKASIILAVFHYNLDILEAYSKKIAGQENRFVKLMEVVIEQQAKYQNLATRITAVEDTITQRVEAIFAEPVAEAKALGTLRQDFVLEKDLMLLLMMIGGSLLLQDGEDKNARIKRALTFVLEGIKR